MRKRNGRDARLGCWAGAVALAFGLALSLPISAQGEQGGLASGDGIEASLVDGQADMGGASAGDADGVADGDAGDGGADAAQAPGDDAQGAGGDGDADGADGTQGAGEDGDADVAQPDDGDGSPQAGVVATVTAQSTTANIVGEVFANSINYMSQASGDDGEAELPSLADYPLDPHERAYYDGTLRLRELCTKGADDDAYLVYRDTFLILSPEDAAGRSVAWSDDGTTAYVSPALDPAALVGRTGIVLLGENVGLDEVLVFGGEPSVDGEGRLAVPVKDPSTMYLSELFSDGQFTISNSVSPQRLRSISRGWLSKDVSGTNWSGTLTNFAPGDLDASLDMNPWELRFGLRLHLECEVDFDITSTGATGGRETKDIASVPIEVAPFTITLAYQLQVEFDEHPVHIAGHMSSDMDYIISTRGAEIENFRTPVDFTTFELMNPARDANKAIELYLGSQFSIDCGILEFEIDLWVAEIKIGPVLSLNQHSMGGVEVVAYLERNSFNKASPDRGLERLHTCCGQGDDGCLSVLSTETARQDITFEINLYFKKFSSTLWDDDEVTIGTKEQHQSLTRNEGLKDGVCPHVLFNVPVAVWKLGPADNPSQPAGEGLAVSLNDINSVTDPIDRELAQGVTDGSGQASIFLPFVAGRKSLITASGEIDANGETIPVIGSAQQPSPMRRGLNDTTNIVLESAADAELRITKEWEVDYKGHEMPEKVQMLVLRQEPSDAAPTPGDDGGAAPTPGDGGGASGGWDGETTVLTPVDIVTLSPSGDGIAIWEAVTGQPKYWLGETASGSPYAYVYTVRELSRGYRTNDFVGPGMTGGTYFPDGYLTDPTLSASALASRREAVMRSAVDKPEESTGSLPTLTCTIPQYVEQGQAVLEHEATYWVSYGEAATASGYHFTVTNTAVQRVFMSKRWISTNGTPKPGYVYLTALWKPAEGWAQIAQSQGVATTWVPVIRPLLGPATTLSDLMADGTMNAIDAHGIDDVPLAIAKVTPSSSDVWRIDYVVPKYWNGVPMEIMASELDTMCVSNLLSYGYDFTEQVQVRDVAAEMGWGSSFCGFPRGSSDMFMLADVVNVDTDPLHTIGGIKTWDNGDFHGMPDSLTIEIWDDAAGDAPVKVGETTIYKSDNPNSNMWPWAFHADDIDSSKAYRLVEVYPDGYNGSNWYSEVNDYNIDNHYVGSNGSKIRINVKFDEACPPVNPWGQGVKIQLLDANDQPLRYPGGLVVPVVTATRVDAYNYYVEVPGWFANDADFASFKIKETNLGDFDPGFMWARNAGGYQAVYSAPVQSFDMGYALAPDTPVWTYTATNLVQEEVNLPAYVYWYDVDGETLLDDYADMGLRPDAVKLTLYQDGIAVNTKYAYENHSSEWMTPMQKDSNGQFLHFLRFDPADGHLYVYTLAEEHVDGYWTKIVLMTSGDDTYSVRFNVNNTLIGDRGVTLRGTVNWEGDEGKEHLRPETVHVVAVCKGETVASVDVPVVDGVWEIKDMPRYDEDGETLLEYSVLESHVDGYTTTYADPSYDAEEHVWTLDLTNKLTGYFPLTVKKVIEDVHEGESTEQEFEFAVEPVDNIAGVDWGFPTPVGWPENLKIQGQGEGLFEFLIDQDGLYLYKVYEVKGTNGLYTYDEAIQSVLVVAVRGADGMMEFQSWVGPEGNVSFDIAGTTTPTGGDNNQDPAPTPGGGDDNQDPAPTPSDGNQDPAPTPGGGDDNQDPAPTPSGDTTGGDDGETTDTDGSSTDSGETSDDWVDTEDVKKIDVVTFTNKGGRSYTVKKEWDFKGKDETKPASIKVQLQRKDKKGDGTTEWVAVETIELTEEGGWKGKFSPVHPDASDIEEAKSPGDEGVPSNPPDGTAAGDGNQPIAPDLPSQWEVDPEGAIIAVMDGRYRIRELTDDGSAVLAVDDEDNEKHEKQGMVVTVTKDGEEQQIGFFATYKKQGDDATGNDGTTGGDGTTGNDGATSGDGTTGNDGNGASAGDETQDSGETIITNTLGKLFTVEKKWEIDAENTDKPASIKAQLQKKEKKEEDDGNGGDGGQGGQGNQGNDGDEKKWEKFDEIEIGDDNSWKGHFKLVELEEKDEDYRVRELDKEDKPVLAKDDPDLEGDDDEKEKYVPTVTYDAGDHETKYLVSYKVDDGKPQHTEITNKAVMDVSLYKRWLMFGDADKPGSVYLMLLGRAKAAEGEDAVPYMPVTDVLYGNKFDAGSVADLVGIKDTMENISEIAYGDKEKFMDNIEDCLDGQGLNFKLAVQKVSADKDDYDKEWHAQFGVAKYDDAGKEREFVGAELVTGLMKIGTDVMVGTDFPVMIQPIPPVYFTVFGYALNIFADYELTGNVINTWIDIDIPDPDPDVPVPDIPIPPIPPVPVPPVPTPPIPPVPTPPTPPNPDPGDPESIGRPIIGSKFWKGDSEEERPSEVKIHVYAHDGDKKWEVAGSPVTAKEADGWAWMLYIEHDDPAYDKEITIEEEVPYGYEASYSGYNVINTKKNPELKTLRGKKTWDDADDQDGKRPESITVRLLADGQEAASKEVTAGDGWKWEFRDFPAKGEDGHEIAYSVSEDPVDGYDTMLDGMDVTNRHVPETIDILVEKVWDDENDTEGKRPASVTVRLRIQGYAVKVETIDALSGWQCTFDDLPRYWKGQEVAYAITEDAVPEYSTEVSEADPPAGSGYAHRFVITNTCTPGKVQVHVTKVWSDEDDRDGIRPETVQAMLLDEGQETGKVVTLSAATGWEATFDGLDYKREGNAVTYSVTEVTDGVITGTDGPGTYGFAVYKDTDGDYSFGILNYHTPETVTVSGSKTWDDDDDEKGHRPEAIVVHLLADGEELTYKTVTAADDWKWDFGALRKYEAGRKIEYSVTESEVGGYDGTVKGYDVLNTPVPEPVTYRVETYYQDKGEYPDTPDEVDERVAMEGEAVSVTEDDMVPGCGGRYALDESAGNVLGGVVPRERDGMLVLKVYFRPYYVITYDPNGGWFLSTGTKPISESHWYGDEIAIHGAPTRLGYEFVCWRGSEYQPGDRYVVTEDHTFVAQWRPVTIPPGTPTTPTGIIPLGDDLTLALGALVAAMAMLGAVVLVRMRNG